MTQSLEQQAEPAAQVATESQRGTAVPETAGGRSSLPLRRVQRQAGNRAAAAMVRRQSSLVVGAADDRHEREADSVADRVVAALRGGVDGAGRGQVIDVGAAPAGPQRRAADPASEAGAVTQVGLEGGPVGVDFEQGVQRAQGGGAPIEASVRRRMEGALGADLSGVRLHSGGESSDLNDKVQAKAFTVGSDIFFRDGVPDMSSSGGQHLLAHEVAHTVQQSGGAQREVQRFWNPFKKSKPQAAAAPAAAGKEPTAAAGTNAPPTPVAPESMTMTDPTMTTAAADTNASATPVAPESAAEVAPSGGTSDLVGTFLSLAEAVKGFAPESEKLPKKELEADGEMPEEKELKAEGKSDETETNASRAAVVGMAAEAGAGVADHVEDTDASEKGVEWAETALGSFLAIKGSLLAMRNICTLVEQRNEMTDEVKVQKSAKVIKQSLEGAKGGVQLARDFLENAGKEVSTDLLGAIPGLGIAISCADLITRAYDLVTSQQAAEEMRDNKQALKVELGGKVGESFDEQAKALLVNGDEVQQAKAREYLFAKGVQSINRKRANRAIIQISVAMAKVAGDAATLGGASAPIGLGLKLAATVMSTGSMLVRMIKQAGRDYAAKSEAKADEKHQADTAAAKKDGTAAPAARKRGILASIFNVDKSKAKKLAGYKQTVGQVFSMITTLAAKAPPQNPAAAKDLDAQAMRVSKYMAAIGYPATQMTRDAGKDTTGAKVRENMIKALMKRE